MIETPERELLFRVAKAFRIWDVDKLEAEMPLCMIMEWDQYLNWEIEQWTKAIMAAIPAAKTIGLDSSNIIKEPTKKAAIFDEMAGRKKGK